MIYAKTGMKRMPWKCRECAQRYSVNGVPTCSVTGLITDLGSKPDWCPLTEIDETLPAQLAAAELRLTEEDRLRNGG